MVSGTGASALAEIIGGPTRTGGPARSDDMAALLAAARHRAGPPLRIRRHESQEGPAYWRWDCDSCGEYGGGRHHSDAIVRATRHCAEHPEHRSSLLPPSRCRERDHRPPVHPMLFAMDDDPTLQPLAG